MDLTVPQLIDMLVERDKLVAEAHAELGRWIDRAANDDATYRREKAKAILTSDASNAQQREAEADLECWQLRARAKISESMKDSAMELIRSRRTQLTAVQTALNAVKEEASFARGASYTP